MAGYTRQSAADIVTGEIVEAAPINAEFNQIQSAFDETTGHAHDGTAGEGPTIPLIADADADTKIHTETSADEDIIRITIAGTELLQIGANSLRKATGSTVGLGSTDNRFDAAFVSSLTTSAATVDDLLVTTGGTADFSGNVLNNVGTSATDTDAANVGYVNAKITSANLAGVTTNALVVGSGGTTDFNGRTLSDVGEPVADTDAATKGWTNSRINASVILGATVYENPGTSGAVTFDLDNGNVQAITVTGSCTFTYSNWNASGDYSALLLLITDGVNLGATDFDGINWFLTDGTTSTTFADLGFTFGSYNEVEITTIDAGTTKYGWVS
jgi:hypothetical protein